MSAAAQEASAEPSSGEAAQEPSAAASSDGAAVDELLGQIVPAEQEGKATEPAPAGQENPEAAGAQQAAAASPDQTAPAGTATAADQPPPAQAEGSTQAAELDVIPLPQRQAAPPVVEKEPPRGRQIEEIVVTSQKREQVMQDVPISMTVLTEQFIREQGITDITDAMRFVPNIKVVEMFGSTSPQCRGFTVNDANPAFEPPCGVAMDGIFYSRAAYFSAGLFDIERLEALRGPQGTTFGKNTTAGVVSVYSKDPTDESTAKVDLQYGGLYERLEAAVGGPLIPDVVNFRIALMKEEREGYMENTYHEIDPSAPAKAGGRSREAFRVKLLFPDVLGGRAKLLYEESELVTHGLLAKYYSKPGSSTHNYLAQHDPKYDGGENYTVSQTGPSDIPTPTRRTHGEWTVPFGEWDVTLLGAFGKIARSYEIVAPAIPVKWVVGRRAENAPFMTAELRTVSPELDGLLGLQDLFGWNLGSSRLVAGIFGMQNKLDPIRGGATINYLQTAGALSAFLPLQGLYVPDAVLYQLQDVASPGSSPGESSNYVFHQTANTAALFAHLTWDMTPKWSLELGGRLSQEKKEADWDVSYSSPAPRSLLNQNGAFVAHKERKESNFQPKISVGYKLTDDINLFAHWARAYKAGGFNYYTVTGNPENGDPPGRLDFDPETATDWGFDVKTTLLDGTMRLNISLFRTLLTDYQVLVEVQGQELTPYNPILGAESQNVPVNYQAVRNAGEALAQGAEIDLMYLPFDWLTVTAAAGYNASKYISFKLDACGGNETKDPETERCDHSGKGFPNVPSWTTSLNLDSRFPLAPLWSGFGDANFLLGAGMEYVTKTSFDGGETGCCDRDPYALYRGHVGVGNPSQGWTLRITGLNLTDEYIYAFRSGTEAYALGAPMPPRTVFAQFNWTYQ